MSMTYSLIEPVTFRLEAQYLDKLLRRDPSLKLYQ